jgi:hypothetical protein
LYEAHVQQTRTKVEEDTAALERRLTGLSTQLAGLIDQVSDVHGHVRAALAELDDLRASQVELGYATDSALAQRPV